MKAYYALFIARFKVLVQYRAAAFAAMATQLFWGFVRMMIFTAFYQLSNASAPIPLTATIAYIWISQALLQLMPWNMDLEIQQIVRTGNVAYELIRPLDLYKLWYARAMAMRFTPTLLRCLPIFSVAIACGWLELPPTWLHALAFLVSVFGALLLSSAITTLLMITLFWTISSDGLIKALTPVVLFLSGMYVPLPLFPDWARYIIDMLPFRGILDIPVHIYTGLIPLQQSLWFIAFQLMWTIILYGVGKLLLKRALKSVVIQGG